MSDSTGKRTGSRIGGAVVGLAAGTVVSLGNPIIAIIGAGVGAVAGPKAVDAIIKKVADKKPGTRI